MLSNLNSSKRKSLQLQRLLTIRQKYSSSMKEASKSQDRIRHYPHAESVTRLAKVNSVKSSKRVDAGSAGPLLVQMELLMVTGAMN